MKRLTSGQIRQKFLDFFAKRDHQVVASSSLVPGNDPTLLFTNAGMVQFKDVFLGLDTRPYKRATTSQKCMRISGKHNDLENVGPSPRHHTFFEMLGNFSFGDYFKKDAIRYAYDLLTKEYGIPAEKLYYTVYQSDDEAYDIWLKDIGVEAARVYRMGPKTNFWQMADTGPCGPTSEVHFDWGPEACTCHQPDCSVLLDNGCERWLEIWNLVFMQFNRSKADPSHSGKFDEPLPSPGVDTGMGLERIVAVLQNARANYETDLFSELMSSTQTILDHSDSFRRDHEIAYRVIADHTRAAVFLVADGVNPGTTGREYITRMLIRRAWRFAHSMGVDKPFLTEVADAVIDMLSDVYPELRQFRDSIHYQISAEEGRFIRTLDNSLVVLNDMIAKHKSDGNLALSGAEAFLLYATHGLPFELTRDLLKDHGLTVDEEGFREALQKHREVDKSVGVLADVSTYKEILDSSDNTKIVYDPYDYDRLERHTRILALISNGERVKHVEEGQNVEVILGETSFYVESGGQVSDTGNIKGNAWQVRVEDTYQPVGGLIVHSGKVISGQVKSGDEASAAADKDRRWDIMRNHTATHLLHASLRHVLGDHVRQKGSLVAPDRLRFDFTHNAPVTSLELEQISQEVNRVIAANSPVEIVEKPLEEARREGAMALFGEKYGDVVRTVSIYDNHNRFSYELCGGTHVRSTSEIGPCLIVAEESSGAGVRRIVALTGRAAHQVIQERMGIVHSVSQILETEPESIEERLTAILDQFREAQARITSLEREFARTEVESLVARSKRVDNVIVIAEQVNTNDAEILGQMADWCRDRLSSGVVLLASNIDGKPRLVAKVTPDLVKRGLHAGNIVGELARMIGGGGGGRPDFATAGGTDPNGLKKAIDRMVPLVSEALK